MRASVPPRTPNRGPAALEPFPRSLQAAVTIIMRPAALFGRGTIFTSAQEIFRGIDDRDRGTSERRAAS